MSTAEYLGFEYLSKYWAIDGTTGMPKAAFVNDDDTCIFPDRLMVLGLKRKYFEIKGFDTSRFDRDYEQEYDLARSHDAGAPTLSQSPRMSSILIGWESIPDSMKPWEYRLLSVEDRVFPRIDKNGPNGCHIFTGAKDGCGYGRVKMKGRGIPVHRWMWEYHNGQIPEGVQVLHRCDNPACVNVEHLFLGTHADNMKDKAAKGRSHNVPSGMRHKRPMAKITEEQARQIKALLARGYRQCDIAQDFGVSRNLVSEIKLGKTWTHV
jgi:hypothetical protein